MVKTILSQLMFNGEYFLQVYPHLKKEYFETGVARRTFTLIQEHYNEYKNIPTPNALAISLEKKSINQVEHDSTLAFLKSVNNTPEDMAWLIKETESYCKDKAMYNALSRAIEIQDNASKPDNERDPRIPDIGAIQDLMKDAVAISFDSSVGHDWFDDYAQRFLLYQTKAKKIPFLIEILNKITKDGAERGTLNVILAGVNVGKSLGLCTLAADYMKSGYNVLYISMEMAEHVVAKRIDANLLDVSMDDLDDGIISFPEYKARMERLTKGSTLGKLKIKQYPTGGANVNHFNALITDLKIKQGWKPDIVMVDYLGICASSRLRVYSENSYTLVKAIAEELRGFAVEHDVVLWTGAQTTRGAWDTSDINMSDVAESAGLPATADFMLAGIETEELAQMGVQMFKQIKSRYGDKNYISKFQLGVKKGNQRWYSVPQPWEDGSGGLPAPTTPTQSAPIQKAVGEATRQVDQNFASKEGKRAMLDELAKGISF